MAALRKKLAKDTEIHRQDNIRVMQVGSSGLEFSLPSFFFLPASEGRLDSRLDEYIFSHNGLVPLIVAMVVLIVEFGGGVFCVYVCMCVCF